MTPSLPISGTTRLYGIVGNPVEQVRSPAVFNGHFAERGVDAIFLPLRVEATRVEAALAGFAALANLDGLIITIPHKLAFAALMDEVGPHGRRVSAVNAVRRTPAGGWAGELFDGLGFVEGLRGQGIDPAGLSYLVFGAGGAGAAIAGALLGVAPTRVAVTDPVAGRAEALCRKLRTGAPGLALFAILFLWQMPHFYAIGWRHRGDYGAAGFRILSTVDPTGRSSARHALAFGLLLVPVSVLPTFLGTAGFVYAAGALLLSAWFAGTAVRFFRETTDGAAKSMFLASIAWLPAIVVLLLADRVAGG